MVRAEVPGATRMVARPRAQVERVRGVGQTLAIVLVIGARQCTLGPTRLDIRERLKSVRFGVFFVIRWVMNIELISTCFLQLTCIFKNSANRSQQIHSFLARLEAYRNFKQRCPTTIITMAPLLSLTFIDWDNVHTLSGSMDNTADRRSSPRSMLSAPLERAQCGSAGQLARWGRVETLCVVESLKCGDRGGAGARALPLVVAVVHLDSLVGARFHHSRVQKLFAGRACPLQCSELGGARAKFG